MSLKMKDFCKNRKSNFSLKCTITMKKARINIKCDDMLMNYTKKDNMAMNSGKLSWWAYKKPFSFFKTLLKAMTLKGHFVLDCTATTNE